MQLTMAAVDEIRSAGKRAAVVGTGADRRHAAARATYRKAGFTPWPNEQLYLLLDDADAAGPYQGGNRPPCDESRPDRRARRNVFRVSEQTVDGLFTHAEGSHHQPPQRGRRFRQHLAEIRPGTALAKTGEWSAGKQHDVVLGVDRAGDAEVEAGVDHG